MFQLQLQLRLSLALFQANPATQYFKITLKLFLNQPKIVHWQQEDYTKTISILLLNIFNSLYFVCVLGLRETILKWVWFQAAGKMVGRYWCWWCVVWWGCLVVILSCDRHTTEWSNLIIKIQISVLTNHHNKGRVRTSFLPTF